MRHKLTAAISSGRLPLAFMLCVTGGILVYLGISGIYEAIERFRPFFPLSLPADVGLQTRNALPFIMVSFAKTVGSLIAALVGLLWVSAGLSEFVKSAVGLSVPKLESPSVAAQWFTANRPAATSLISRITARFLGSERALDGASEALLRRLAGSCVFVLVLTGVIVIAAKLVALAPGLLSKYFGVTGHFVIASPGPLYVLTVCALLINAMCAVSLFPLKKRRFETRSDRLDVVGHGAPVLFFALIEECCKLLNAETSRSHAATRLRAEGAAGTLVETVPVRAHFYGRPAMYICLPFAALFNILGFRRLIHFNRPSEPMPYTEFLTNHFTDYALEGLIAFGLILLGFYFAEWAARYADSERFSSLMALFVHRIESGSTSSPKDSSVKFSETEGIDPALISWMNDPRRETAFTIECFWAEAVTESVGQGTGRTIRELIASKPLEESMRRILETVSEVRFRRENTPAELAHPDAEIEPDIT